MNVLLTGGSGFVGGRLAKALVERGHKVTALVRRRLRPHGAEDPGNQHRGGRPPQRRRDRRGGRRRRGGAPGRGHQGRSEDDYLRGNAETTRMLAAALARRSVRPGWCTAPRWRRRARRASAILAPRRSHPARCRCTAEQARRGAGGPGLLRPSPHRRRPPAVRLRPGRPDQPPPADRDGKTGVFFKPGFGPKYFSFVHVDDLGEALALAERG